MTHPAPSTQRNIVPWLLAAALGAALLYISRLQRALITAQQRGDMYRDIAAALDRRGELNQEHM